MNETIEYEFPEISLPLLDETVVEEEKKNLGGRPPKWETVEELQELLYDYFDSCWTIKLDQFGNKIKDKDSGEFVMHQTRPYTITGIAVALGCDRDTLLNYGKKEKFFGTIKRAKQMCHNYAEESLYIGKNPTGAIFNLKNNYGWKDKFEVDSKNKNLNENHDISKERAERIKKAVIDSTSQLPKKK